MKPVNIRFYRAREINFANKVENGTKIEFENKYSYNVNYASGQNVGKGIINLSAISKNDPKKFFVSIELEGVFDYDPSLTKEQVHVESFNQLFPYAKSLISTVSAASGIPPIMVPAIDISQQSIYRYDMRNPFGNNQNEGEDEE